MFMFTHYTLSRIKHMFVGSERRKKKKKNEKKQNKTKRNEFRDFLPSTAIKSNMASIRFVQIGESY